MFDRLYDLDLVVLYPALIVLIAGAGELGAWLEVLSEERRVLSGKFRRRFQRAACKSYSA